MMKANVLRDLVLDYEEERKECEEAIKSMQLKIATYRNRIKEIDEISIGLMQSYADQRT